MEQFYLVEELLVSFMQKFIFIKNHNLTLTIKYYIAFFAFILGKFRPNYNPNTNKVNRIWDLMYFQSLFSYELFILVFAIHFYLFPTDPAYAYQSVINMFSDVPEQANSLLCRVTYHIYGAFNIYIQAKINFTLAFTVDSTVLSFFVLGRFLRKELRFKSIAKDEMSQYKTSRTLRTIPNLTTYYRALQLLLKLYIESFGILVAASHVLMFSLMIFSQISLITRWSRLNNIMKTILLICVLVGDIIWLCSIDLLGRLVSESRKTVGSWKQISIIGWETKGDVAAMKKFVVSCKPLIIRCGVIYSVERSTVLNFIKTTSWWTFKGVIASHRG